MSMLYLVRHGQASAGTDNYDRLSPTGRRQSQLLGQWWQSQGFSPDQAYHGSLIRQRDTASLALESLGSNLQTEVHNDLNEYTHRVIDAHFGNNIDTGNSESMAFNDYVAVMQRWREHQSDPNTPEIEPWEKFSTRGWLAIEALYKRHSDKEHHVFFTSGGVIATVLSAVLNVDFSHTVDAIWRIRNSSITTLHFDGKHARLIEFNTIAHLQTQHDPALITLI